MIFGVALLKKYVCRKFPGVEEGGRGVIKKVFEYQYFKNVRILNISQLQTRKRGMPNIGPQINNKLTFCSPGAHPLHYTFIQDEEINRLWKKCV